MSWSHQGWVVILMAPGRLVRPTRAIFRMLGTDTHFVHLAWRQSHADSKSLPFPMLADTEREPATALGVLHEQDPVALRATFIVDPTGVIRHVSVNDLSVGRSVAEVLRVLDALQSDELCPCNWQMGEANLEVA
jgi:alkyl hydroperoxide reductase subunit AhpC